MTRNTSSKRNTTLTTTTRHSWERTRRAPLTNSLQRKAETGSGKGEDDGVDGRGRRRRCSEKRKGGRVVEWKRKER